ncbi:MAG TPA: nitrite reductase small subunit NirD [bacterium]|nr:nitrite reductase small subunit NirD [bacterium]
MSDTKQIKWFRIAEAGSIPEKEGRRVQYGPHVVALFNLGKEYLAVENQCPHKGGPLADGIVAGKNVFCPLHNWKINLENGCALSGGTGQVKTFPVKVAGNEIYLAFEEAQLQTCEPSGPAPDIQAAKDMGG